MPNPLMGFYPSELSPSKELGTLPSLHTFLVLSSSRPDRLPRRVDWFSTCQHCQRPRTPGQAQRAADNRRCSSSVWPTVTSGRRQSCIATTEPTSRSGAVFRRFTRAAVVRQWHGKPTIHVHATCAMHRPRLSEQAEAHTPRQRLADLLTRPTNGLIGRSRENPTSI